MIQECVYHMPHTYTIIEQISSKQFDNIVFTLVLNKNSQKYIGLIGSFQDYVDYSSADDIHEKCIPLTFSISFFVFKSQNLREDQYEH